MKGFEESCREASEILNRMAETARDHRYRKLLSGLALDTLCASVWIENMRKVEFYFAQMFPEEYEKTLRQMQEDTEKEFKYE